MVPVFRRGKQEIRNLIGEQAIDFLRHGAVKGTQSGFDVTDAKSEFRAHQGCGQRRIHIAVNQHQVGTLADNHILKSLHNLRCLLGVTSRTDLQIHIGSGNAKLLKKNLGHVEIVVLTRMHYNLANCRPRSERAMHGRGFHEVGAGPHDVENFHFGLMNSIDEFTRADWNSVALRQL